MARYRASCTSLVNGEISCFLYLSRKWRDVVLPVLFLQSSGPLVNRLIVHRTERSVSITVPWPSCRVSVIFCPNLKCGGKFQWKSHTWTFTKIRSAWVAFIHSERQTAGGRMGTHDEASSTFSHTSLRTCLKWNNLDGKLNVNACRLMSHPLPVQKNHGHVPIQLLLRPYTDNSSWKWRHNHTKLIANRRVI